jgi:indolepyruvate ferredoxin oxidoreductase alpha subunit
MTKHLLSGNEAIARGAYEAGVKVCSAYPGTPSTEIFESLPQYKDALYCEWAPNEKVATEVAYGAAIGGVRSLCAMKHVGLNVAADPLFTAAYNGINRGFVIVTADDPSMHSSQNEQDNRYYARAAKVALVEPSDSQECIDFMKEAYRISEQFDMPVLFRTTTRISHSKSLVTFGEREEALSHALVGRGFAAFVASDAHTPVVRTPWMRDVWELLSEEYSPDAAQALLKDNAARVLQNRDINIPEPDWFD